MKRTLMMLRGAAAVILVATLLTGCSGTPEEETADTALLAELRAYAESHGMHPTDYILRKFQDHDVIFIGEVHRVKHDVEFVKALIPRLYEQGIYYLGTEFGRREDQALIDSLVLGAEYDEDLARRVTLQQYVFWGYQEYVDIYRAAWEVNHSRQQGSPPFRVLGLNNSPDWSHVEESSDRDRGYVMKKVWHGQTEEDWARVILDSVVARGEKMLVYSGMHHAFTEYRQPVVVNGQFVRFGEMRMGNYVYDAIGKRAITIYLHGPWNSAAGYDRGVVRPADGVINQAMAELDPAILPIAFDTRGTPFGDLKGETSVYSHGYDDFRLAMFCDGYIYHRPFAEYEGVTPIAGFINESNIAYARAQSPDPSFRDKSPADFNRAIARYAEVSRWRLR